MEILAVRHHAVLIRSQSQLTSLYCITVPIPCQALTGFPGPREASQRYVMGELYHDSLTLSTVGFLIGSLHGVSVYPSHSLGI